jgi:hypothetical protein
LGLGCADGGIRRRNLGFCRADGGLRTFEARTVVVQRLNRAGTALGELLGAVEAPLRLHFSDTAITH